MLREKPYAKGTFNLANYYYGYTEIPQNSDQTPFRLAGIPTALFFSGTYDVKPWNYAESKDPNKSVMNSAQDTFDNLDKYNGAQFVDKNQRRSKQRRANGLGRRIRNGRR